MTYEKGIDVFLDAGFVAKADAPAAVKALDLSSIGMTCPAQVGALVKAGLLDKASKEAAASLMEDAQWAETDDDPEAFDDDLEGTGLL